MKKVIVRIADSVVVHNPTVLVTTVGSCVGIALRDPSAKIGALAHIMLPCSKSNKKALPLKFADSAIEITLDEMIQKGCSKNRIEAKIAGGASMFEFGVSSMKIGERNVEAVVNKLDEYNIPILARDIGKNYGRTLEFYVETGILHVKNALKGLNKI